MMIRGGLGRVVGDARSTKRKMGKSGVVAQMICSPRRLSFYT